MRVEHQDVARLTQNQDFVGVDHVRLRQTPWHSCSTPVRLRDDSGRSILSGELIQHPNQRQRIDVVNPAGRSIAVQPLRSGSPAGISSVDVNLEVTESLAEQIPNSRVTGEFPPSIDVRCLVVDLGVKRRTRSPGGKRRT